MAPEATVDPRGQNAEDAACRYLEGRGLRILARNVRSRFGEIDIVARDGDTLVFVEVKGRRDSLHGSGFEAVTARKRQKIVRAARAYAASRGLSDTAIRFDVVALRWGSGAAPIIEHAHSAFNADGE